MAQYHPNHRIKTITKREKKSRILSVRAEDLMEAIQRSMPISKENMMELYLFFLFKAPG
jgi:hypothetical protein